jgi:CheY-like chemotaxis protein
MSSTNYDKFGRKERPKQQLQITWEDRLKLWSSGMDFLYKVGKAAVLIAIIILLFAFRAKVPDALKNLQSFEFLGIKGTFNEASKKLLNAAEAAEAAKHKGNMPEGIERWSAPDEETQETLDRVRRVASVYRGARILWVDDYPANNHLTTTFFDSLGANVFLAMSTEEALNKLERVEKFDIIISDMFRDASGVTNKIGGIETVNAMRAKLKKVPVIFFTPDYEKGKEVYIQMMASQGNTNANLEFENNQGRTDNYWELINLVTDQLERHSRK